MDNSEPIKIIAIKTKNGVYISDNIKNENYFRTQLSNLLFDGSRSEATHHPEWSQIKSIPVKIEKMLPRISINNRYELREKHYSTGLPKVLPSGSFGDESEYESVYGLYESKCEYQDGELEEVSFELNVIEELENFEITRSDYKLEHYIIDRITTHPILLTTKPCHLTRDESYKIVRSYIKKNIDSKYAKISSDYDFCFSVEKRLEYDVPRSYQVNVGSRKPKYQTRFAQDYGVKIFEIAPKGYEKYPIIEPFKGLNEEDLNKNIQIYLDELMQAINEPISECTHCKGRGAIIKERKI